MKSFCVAAIVLLLAANVEAQQTISIDQNASSITHVGAATYDIELDHSWNVPDLVFGVKTFEYYEEGLLGGTWETMSSHLIIGTTGEVNEIETEAWLANVIALPKKFRFHIDGQLIDGTPVSITSNVVTLFPDLSTPKNR